MSTNEHPIITNGQTSETRLTIIIPFLNEGEEVGNTLNSIRTTAGNKVDIIIINDTSTDNAVYRISAHKFNAKYIKNKKRLGVAASRDLGVSLINTPYFLLLDAHMRFYQNDWVEQIVEELDKNDRVLLCCNTKILSKKESGDIDESNNNLAFGATINFQGNKCMLNAEWAAWEKNPEAVIEDISCVLGAGYAASKRYWQYLRGLEGLVYYGSDETYISLKVWLEGGKCRLLKNIKIGHIYRNQAPYKIESTDTIFNKLWIAELLLPFSYKLRTFGALYEENPQNFKEAFQRLQEKQKKTNELKQYYHNIFTVDFAQIVQLNKKITIENIDLEKKKQECLKKLFNRILLNCNTISTEGLWHGRIGCILFIAKYDQIKNKNLYEDLIDELIDKVFTQIEKDCLNIDLGEGLCGVAYGIAWLLHHHLVEGDINDILEEVDSRIMERDPLRIKDYSLKNGLAGILYYVLYRLQIAQEENLPLPFDKKYLSDLYKVSLYVLKDIEKSASFEMASWMVAYMRNPNLKLEIPDIIQILNLSALQDVSINSYTQGLKDGLSGLALSKLT